MISTGKHGRKIQLFTNKFIPVGAIFVHEPTGLCTEVVADPDEFCNCGECVFETICSSGKYQLPKCDSRHREDHQEVYFRKL